ncbi:EcsC family protein [Achromobacter sp. F4_2707]|uniref:EcsC family protein n=1 Tax=Achromobacter sp. F4_2707 TaxID=3114286 RepID=UPI0039C5AA71
MIPLDSPEDLETLTKAVALLESPSLTIRIANLVGTPVEWAMKKLPGSTADKVQKAIKVALQKAVGGALRTMDDTSTAAARPKTHTAMVAASGAVGGFFGLKGTLIELPITTTLIMRSVADIARSEGFSVKDPLIQAECVQVFALGGRSPDDDAADSAYYAARVGLNELARETSRLLAESAAHHSAGMAAQGMQLPSGQAAAWLAQIIEAVAQRFGVKVTEKLALQAAPVLGAASGAAINAMFISHYQDMARGHFAIRRLEEKYGEAVIRDAYKAVQERLNRSS